MKSISHYLIPSLALLAFSTLNSQPSTAFAQNTTFTYQGLVTDNGTNFTGTGQFQFALVTSTNFNHQATATANAPSGGFITGYAVTSGGSGYVTAPAVSIFGGGGSGAAATANISSGAVTSLTVHNTGNGAYTSAPTVTIAPPPASLSYQTYWSNDGTSVNGSEPTASVNIGVTNGLFTVVLGDGTLPDMLPIGAALFNQPNLQLRIWFNDGSHGFAALNPAQNLTPTPYATYATTAGELVSGLTVQGNTNGAPNVIGGAANNYVSNSVVGATIGGGGAVNYTGAAFTNSVVGNFGTVSGGAANTAGNSATVGGGYQNTASGLDATVGGGLDNTASLDSATVGGGYNNLASNGSTTVAGGFDNVASGNVATVGGGGHNTASGDYSVVAGGSSSSATNVFAAIGGGVANLAGGKSSMVSGGQDNTASADYSTVGGGAANIAASASTTVGGGFYNAASNNAATVGGGANNTAGGTYSTVAGGNFNVASGNTATVVGGYTNIASGDYSTAMGYQSTASAPFATAMGWGTTASGYSASTAMGVGTAASGFASTAMGDATTASGEYATAIGYHTTASGLLSTAMGDYTTASGVGSTAMGHYAMAVNDESFVWNDGSGGPGVAFASTTTNQFAVHAAGGVLLAADIQMGTNASDYHHFTLGGGNSYGYLYGSYTAFGDGIHLGYNIYYGANGNGHIANTGGATSRITAGYGVIKLDIGGVNAQPTTDRLVADSTGVAVYGTFNNSSDRNAKQDFAPVSAGQILDKVLQLPVSEWSYKTDAATRHIGPMGQDFYATFNIGTDEKHIAPIDEGGVALAAIQGLNQKVEEKDAKIRELEARLEKLEQLINENNGGVK